VCAVVLEALGKIPPSALVATIAAITSTGLGVIGSIAWEDSATKGQRLVRASDKDRWHDFDQSALETATQQIVDAQRTDAAAQDNIKTDPPAPAA
jgi:hypothetical protein